MDSSIRRWVCTLTIRTPQLENKQTHLGNSTFYNFRKCVANNTYLGTLWNFKPRDPETPKHRPKSFFSPTYTVYTTLLHKILRQYLWERSLTTSFHCGIWTARSARVRHSCWGESVILFKIFTFWFLYCINIYHSIEKKANQNTGNPLYILSITHNHLIMGCADVPLMTAFGMEWYEIVMQCSFMVNASVYTKKINTNQLGRKVYKYSKSLSATVSEIGVECYTYNSHKFL